MKLLRRKLDMLGWPFFAAFVLLYLAPFLYTVWYALLNNAFEGRFVGLENFVAIGGNRYFQLAVRNTAIITLLLTGVTALAALALGFFLQEGQPKGLSLLAVLVLPMLIPSVSAAALWKRLFDTGAFASASACYGALTTLFLWKYAGAAATLLYAGLRAVEPGILDAAALDGAGAIRSYVCISLPCIRGHVAVMLMLLTMFAFRIYKESYLLFGMYPSDEMYLLAHYMSNHFIKLNYQNVAVSSLCLAVFALLLFALAGSLRRKEAAL